ncbi:type II secretion system F family protein [Aureliella helgolandensis]|uniref:Bacterial type II secretion system protein F domain protein n=1 Tax=Aureliella helgolandensis TaxID=2527968 RepID=A0A518G0K0_9BACT|nr:type II secretion system F family protein [Aureliella helgolandensis]QDV22137.1 Bacterial type II secretion system protein F domain protein [Aureliella helgolandensis]
MLLAVTTLNALIVPAASFIAIGVLAWMALGFFLDKDDRAEQRLQEFSDPRRKGGRNEKKSETIARVLQKASPTLAKPLTPTSEKEMSKLRQDLVEAGFRSETAPLTYLAVRTASALAFLVMGGGGALLLYGFTSTAAIRTFFVGAIGFYLPTLALGYLVKRRKNKIFLGLPDALDLMVVCVEAGLGLDQAMRRVSEEMKKSYRVIADEFGLCNLHLQMGRARNQVLTDLGARTGVDDLRALASILIQADKFGSSIAKALRVQSDSMRTRRAQVAEEKAAKTAVKLIFPLVLFIFPGIFVVLVGPAGIQMAREMFPAMNGSK